MPSYWQRLGLSSVAAGRQMPYLSANPLKCGYVLATCWLRVGYFESRQPGILSIRQQ